MTYQDALNYLDSFIDYEKTTQWEYPEAFKLDRMRGLAREFGNPQNAYDSVIIAGSKGKGSTAAILSSILRMENLRVGLYTSPHLQDLSERIQVNGLPISEQRLTDAVQLLRRILDSTQWRRNPPTYFEILTALAFHHFKNMKAHLAVLEVGLGGLVDSTNIAEAKAVGLAPISLEHTDKLGKTVAKIAVQKTGVIKGREVVVSAPQASEAAAVIGKAAEQNEATLWRVGHEIKISTRDHGEDYQKFDLRAPFGNYFDLELRLLGRHQIDNAAVAVGLAKGLEKKTRLVLSEAAVRRGVLDAAWPGRLERIGRNPDIVLDGAQNPDSMSKLMLALKRHFHFARLITVLGVSADKDLTGILREILPETAIFIATRAQSPRALEPEAIARAVENFDGEIFTQPDASSAMAQAKRLAREGDLILVTGSLFLVGEVRKR